MYSLNYFLAVLGVPLYLGMGLHFCKPIFQLLRLYCVKGDEDFETGGGGVGRSLF
jgi:hypothetical protein